MLAAAAVVAEEGVVVGREVVEMLAALAACSSDVLARVLVAVVRTVVAPPF